MLVTLKWIEDYRLLWITRSKTPGEININKYNSKLFLLILKYFHAIFYYSFDVKNIIYTDYKTVKKVIYSSITGKSKLVRVREEGK